VSHRIDERIGCNRSTARRAGAFAETASACATALACGSCGGATCATRATNICARFATGTAVDTAGSARGAACLASGSADGHTA
jgi:hypothetical protein